MQKIKWKNILICLLIGISIGMYSTIRNLRDELKESNDEVRIQTHLKELREADVDYWKLKHEKLDDTIRYTEQINELESELGSDEVESDNE